MTATKGGTKLASAVTRDAMDSGATQPEAMKCTARTEETREATEDEVMKHTVTKLEEIQREVRQRLAMIYLTLCDVTL